MRLERIEPRAGREDLLAEKAVVPLIDLDGDSFGCQEDLDELAELSGGRPPENGQPQGVAPALGRLPGLKEPTKLHQ